MPENTKDPQRSNAFFFAVRTAARRHAENSGDADFEAGDLECLLHALYEACPAPLVYDALERALSGPNFADVPEYDMVRRRLLRLRD